MKAILKLYFGILILLIASLTFSYKINSLCIIALFGVWLVDTSFAMKFRKLIKEPFFIGNVLLFGFYLLGIALSEDKSTARFFVEKNLSLIAIPLVLLSMKRITKDQFFVLGKIFVACTCVLMLLALVLATRYWFQVHNYNVLFYHKLAGQVGISAIIASLLCIVSLAILFELPGFGILKWICVTFLSLCLVLLSSKLFLLMLGIMILLNVLKHIKPKARIMLCLSVIIIALLIAFTPNPISRRFKDMSKFHLEYLSAKKYNPGMYFDGLSMRLIYIKFGFEIFREDGNYLLGVGTGDAENLLKDKIKAYDMYQGDGVKNKLGYLEYGFHNQLLQKLLQLGLIGFTLFLGLIIYCFTIAIKYKNKFLLNLMLIFSLTFFTDTLLEHQVGLVMFLSFTCLAINQIRLKQETQNNILQSI
jgi:O-antigen ligase